MLFGQVEILQTLGNYTFAADFESDDFLQKLIGLLKKPDSTKINLLPAPWREKFRYLSVDSNNYLHMDERLVIPKLLRPIIMRSMHYGHPGHESMLATVSNVWWPRLHREVVGIARACQQCQVAGKNIKPLLTQNQIRKLPKIVENNQDIAVENNQEIAIDSAGPLQNANKANKILIVSIDLFN